MTATEDFPDNLVVKTMPSSGRGEGSVPGQRDKIPHATWPKTQNIKQKQYCRKFNKDLKSCPHYKEKKIFFFFLNYKGLPW